MIKADYKYWSILFFWGMEIFSLSIQAQNLALNKSYSLSTPPNYPQSALPSDKTSLTDGIYTKGKYFWLQHSTVGWQLEEVSITIDLGKMEPINEVTFNTVRAINSSINFPQNIFIFISADNESFKYIGDAANDSANLPGEIEVKKFILANIAQTARYIRLTIIPQGSYLFCDEIEVRKGRKIGNSKDLIPKSSLTRVVDSLKLLGYQHKVLSKAVLKMEKFSIIKNVKSKIELTKLSSRLNNNNLSPNNLKAIKVDIAKKNADLIKKKFNLPFILERSNPWDSLNEFHEPKESVKIINYQFLIATDDVQYGSFIITNSNLTPQNFSFKVSSNISQNAIELYNVPFVPSSNNMLIPDPLLKIGDHITIDPGVSKMFLFKVTGIKTGFGTSTIAISSVNKSVEVNIETHILDLLWQNKIENLNINVWAYLNNAMLTSHKEEAAKDLELHHVNTIVIPSGILPFMGTDDFNRFINYLSNFKDIKNILLPMEHTSLDNQKNFKGERFMSEKWKNNFRKWYGSMSTLVHTHGFSDSHIYFYPFDEVSANNIEDFRSLILWAKKNIPGIKFYATLNTKVAIDSILPLIDIAQIIPALANTNKLPRHQCEIWIYSSYTPSRALSPYKYYRLMAWDAFVNNYKGIGFWNYADERNGNKLNLISDMPNFQGSYSVIYNGIGGEIISSRRWEAFKQGIEDYSILQLYSNKFGTNKAKALAKEVLSNSANLGKADSMRNVMITEMTGIK